MFTHCKQHISTGVHVHAHVYNVSWYLSFLHYIVFLVLSIMHLEHAHTTSNTCIYTYLYMSMRAVITASMWFSLQACWSIRLRYATSQGMVTHKWPRSHDSRKHRWRSSGPVWTRREGRLISNARNFQQHKLHGLVGFCPEWWLSRCYRHQPESNQSAST